MDTSTLNVISACAGIGGIDLGLSLVLPARTVCFVENEATAARILAARMEDGCLDPAPVWSDLKTFDGRPWRRCVDIFCAGYPCQPFSVAGKQRGEKDPRHLWPHVRRVYRELEAPILFFENVENHLRIGFDKVLRDLRRDGYTVEAGIFSAAEIGAPHLRKRLFILAYRDDAGLEALDQFSRSEWAEWIGHPGFELADSEGEGRRLQPEREERERWRSRTGSAITQLAHSAQRGRGIVRQSSGRHGFADGRGAELDHPNAERQDDGRTRPQAVRHGWHDDERSASAKSGHKLADAGHGLVPLARRGSQRRAGARPAGEAVADAAHDNRWRGIGGAEEGTGPDGIGRRVSAECGLFPPGPDQLAEWREVLRRDPEAKPAIRGMADGISGRVDRLRTLGNGVVPIVAAYAFGSLARAAVARIDIAENGLKSTARAA